MRMLYNSRVKSILEEVPSARGSDDVLFAEYLRRYDTSLSSSERDVIIRSFKDWSGVNYDTLRRSRQRVQELHPELKPPDRITSFREERKDQIISELYEGEHHNG